MVNTALKPRETEFAGNFNEFTKIHTLFDIHLKLNQGLCQCLLNALRWKWEDGPNFFLHENFTIQRADEADQLSTLGGLQAHYNTMAHCDEFVMVVCRNLFIASGCDDNINLANTLIRAFSFKYS